MSQGGAKVFDLGDRVYDFAIAALERACSHLPTCPWCDCKAAKLPRGGVLCLWCNRRTLDAEYIGGTRIWRRVA